MTNGEFGIRNAEKTLGSWEVRRLGRGEVERLGSGKSSKQRIINHRPVFAPLSFAAASPTQTIRT